MARKGGCPCSRYEKPRSISRPTPSSATAQIRLSAIMPARIVGENRQSCEPGDLPAHEDHDQDQRQEPRVGKADRRQACRIQASAPDRSVRLAGVAAKGQDGSS